MLIIVLLFGVADFDFICRLNEVAYRRGKVIKVHLEIETGMNRTGFFLSNLKSHIDEILGLSNVVVDGVYSHLSSADGDDSYTRLQFDRFADARDFLLSKICLRYVHLSASSGVLNFNCFGCNTIRPGLILYGFEAFDNSYGKLDLRPVACLRSKISFVKSVSAGERVGYSGSFVLSKDAKIATVPIGYADGMDRSLSNCGFVVVNGCLVPIVGMVCMDSFMVDVSRVDVCVR